MTQFWLWLIAGCITLFVIWLVKINLTRSIPLTTSAANQPPPYSESLGSMHCHTVYSDGAGDLAEIVQACHTVELDFLVTTDHNTWQPALEGWEGWHGRTMILVGEEVSTDAGHLLVFNIGQKIPVRDRQGAIDFVNSKGGISVIAHPQNMKVPWRIWDVQGFTGLEVINFDSMCRRKAIQITGIADLLAYMRDICGLRRVLINNAPSRELAYWDTLTQQRKLIALGGVDAHGYLKVGKKMYRKPSYEHMFRTVYTHLLTKQPFTKDINYDRPLFYQALAAGNVFIAFDAIACAKGFTFHADNGSTAAIIGDEIELNSQQPVTLHVNLPPNSRGIVRIIHNGKLLTEASGSSLALQVKETDVYRVEVYQYKYRLPGGIHFRPIPWIYSNPIYVKGSQP